MLAQKGIYEKNLKTRPKIQGVQISSNSDMVMNEKFESDFHKICEAFNYNDETMINFDLFVQLYEYLGFVKSPEIENLILDEIFGHLNGGFEQDVIPVSFALKFARCIQNFHHQDVVDTNREGTIVNKS